MNPAPIILFVYNRPWHTRQTVTALQKNHLAGMSDITIFSDGPKTPRDAEPVQTVRKYIRKISGFNRIAIHENEKNKGLADSIIEGVGAVISRHDRAIILEDDLVSSPHFLRYMNLALKFYNDHHKVFSISGYGFPPALMKIPAAYPYSTYFSYRNSSWGWATWRSRWDQVDWDVPDFLEFMSDKQSRKRFNRGGGDLSTLLACQMAGEIDSWSIRWTYSQYRHDALSLYPIHSYINNIGLDGSGEHCGVSKNLENCLSDNDAAPRFPPRAVVDPGIAAAFKRIYQKGICVRIWHFLKNAANNQVNR